MQGTIALVGAGEFLDAMNAVDVELLARAGGRRVAILPTASTPDGPGVPQRWAQLGIGHFTRLGAQAEGVMALARADCEEPGLAERVRAANLVYFSGGKPDYLHDTLAGTQVWQAVAEVLARGGVLAGCSAGAMIMGSFVPVFSSWGGLPRVKEWQPAFGLIPSAIVIPHYDQVPEFLLGLITGRLPKGTFILGIDRDTALVGSDGSWRAMGAGRVTLRRGRAVSRFTQGHAVPL